MQEIWLSAKSFSTTFAFIGSAKYLNKLNKNRVNTHEWSKIITAFFACAYRPALLGLPTEVFAFHFSFFKILFIGVTAGLFGSAVSVFLSEELIVFSEYLMKKFFPNRKKKRRITRTNRFLIQAKRYFGITGIAAISPLILSIPFGTFLAIRFFGYKNRNRTILYMGISSAFWTILLYFIYHKFYHHLMHFFK
jgi:type IV secretory pathway VirB3-like protein